MSDIQMTICILALVLALICIGVLASRLITARKRSAHMEGELRAARGRHDAETNRWAELRGALQAENRQLSKWQVVGDAQAHAESIVKEAEQRAATEDARRAQLVEQGRRAVAEAESRATQVIEEAKVKAHEVAGEALEVKGNMEFYERSVKALKNLVEGYGNQYIVPGHSLLDELAADFGHTEAGQELKRARDRAKQMIRDGTAATCEYVEDNRRETAIRFVIDAFNGKADSILSRVKSDNAGTLGQEMRDAFALVNLNGKAFRDARITEPYLEVRLAELKWAAVAQELRIAEREEQRRIKEQIREEERARREFERAMRDSAKEEELLRKAMEKAQQQVSQASAEQKAQYEHQLQELSERLKEAEERNQRAMSMAQQTKRGHVYIISNVGSFGDHVYKIGLTRRLEPLDRIRELGDSSVPFEFDVHALLFSEDAPALETRLHKHFLLNQINKVNYRKEFFRVDLSHIRQEIDTLGLSAKWTMTAAAQEYRETQAIETAIKDDPAKREAWISRQLELDPVSEIGVPAGAASDGE